MVQSFWLEGTSRVKSIAAASRVKVSADGHGVVSHAGMGLLRELAELTGLSAQVTAALADTYRGPWVYEASTAFDGFYRSDTLQNSSYTDLSCYSTVRSHERYPHARSDFHPG